MQGLFYLSGIWNLDSECKTGIVKWQPDGISTETKVDEVKKIMYLILI